MKERNEYLEMLAYNELTKMLESPETDSKTRLNAIKYALSNIGYKTGFSDKILQDIGDNSKYDVSRLTKEDLSELIKIKNKMIKPDSSNGNG